MDEEAPLSEAFGAHDEIFLQRICSFGALCVLTVVTFASILTHSRNIYRISKDGLLPKFISKVHPKYKTPINATIIIAGLSMLLGLFLNISSVIQMASAAALLQYTIVVGGVLIIRYSPDQYLKYQEQLKHEYMSKIDERGRDNTPTNGENENDRTIGKSMDFTNSLKTYQSFKDKQNTKKNSISAKTITTMETGNDNKTDLLRPIHSLKKKPKKVREFEWMSTDNGLDMNKWSHIKITKIIWLFILFSIIISFLILNQEWFFDNDIQGLYFIFLTIFCICIIFDFLLIIYAHYNRYDIC